MKPPMNSGTLFYATAILAVFFMLLSLEIIELTFTNVVIAGLAIMAAYAYGLRPEEYKITLYEGQQLVIEYIRLAQRELNMPNGMITIMADAEEKTLAYQGQLVPEKYVILCMIEGEETHYYSFQVSLKGRIIGISPITSSVTARNYEPQYRVLGGLPPQEQPKPKEREIGKEEK